MLDVPHPPTSTIAVQYLIRLSQVLPLASGGAMARAIDLLLKTRAAGGRVYVAGNGGSAATASHFVCDLVKTAHVPGIAPFRAFALADNTPLLTAWANDRAYERSFAEQILALVDPEDVVIVITASGNSPNIIRAVEAASACGARTIGLLGFDGGAVKQMVDVALHIPCADYGLVEDTHAAIAHALATEIRQTLAEKRC
jgi:D-sedoheptulose 7-phosphate isomerase